MAVAMDGVSLLLLLLLLLAVGSKAALQVFILAGQSNMGGRGGANSTNWDGYVPHDCAPSPRIVRLSPDLRWEEAREPLHTGIDVHNVLGVGPGMPFAHALLRSGAGASMSTIGLIPCAQGGTPIANWSRGTELYERMVERARAGQAAADGKLAALLWYQGEADTIRREDAEAYTARMEAMVRDVRRDLALPDLLVIQVGIATGQGQFIQPVREAQRAVKMDRVRYVDAMGLPVATDHVHLTTQAQLRLGHMLAKEYLAATHTR